jgi:XTP/dITP diphosphohydrolase
MAPGMTTLLIATRNLHKLGEIRAILGEAHAYLTLADFPDAPPLIEDADTFEGNAARKALTLARWLGGKAGGFPVVRRGSEIPVAVWPDFILADDSGLEVDALGGAPGVRSARFAASDSGASGNSSDAANNAKLLRLLRDVPWDQRTARFRCVLAVARPSPEDATGGPAFFEGVCEGHIAFEPRGAGGFGYDPLFIPEGFEQTFAELGETVKNRLSHRARALAKFREWLERRAATPSP